MGTERAAWMAMVVLRLCLYCMFHLSGDDSRDLEMVIRLFFDECS